MVEYLQKCLHRQISIQPKTDLPAQLPLRYKGCYDLFLVSDGSVEWLLAEPKQPIRLSTLRKDWRELEKTSNLNCAFCFAAINFYTKQILLEEGIPFVQKDAQMYLPFLGMLLSKKGERNLPVVRTISYLTQKMLLLAFYEKWKDVNVTKASERLGVTKMSASRCFDEIEYLEMDIFDKSGKYRMLTVGENSQEYLDKIRPHLKNPIIRSYELVQDADLEKKAGISALCAYSLLEDNPYPTYAITKKELKESPLKICRQVSRGEDVGCVVLEVGYFLDFYKNNCQDPISTRLTLTEEELEEDRVGIAVKEMMEAYVWSED